MVYEKITALSKQKNVKILGCLMYGINSILDNFGPRQFNIKSVIPLAVHLAGQSNP